MANPSEKDLADEIEDADDLGPVATDMRLVAELGSSKKDKPSSGIFLSILAKVVASLVAFTADGLAVLWAGLDVIVTGVDPNITTTQRWYYRLSDGPNMLFNSGMLITFTVFVHEQTKVGWVWVWDLEYESPVSFFALGLMLSALVWGIIYSSVTKSLKADD